MDAIEKIRGKKLLIVDDEQDILDTLIDYLDVCKIDTATSFEEGKRLLETNEYHVAVLDISMPEVNGIEATEQITGLDATTHIIILSMHSTSRLKRCSTCRS